MMTIRRTLTTLLLVASSTLMLAACGNSDSASNASSTKSASVAKVNSKSAAASKAKADSTSKAKASSQATAKAASSSKAKAAAESSAAAASAAKASSQAAAASASSAKAAAASSQAAAASTQATNRAYALQHPINELDEASATLVTAHLSEALGFPKYAISRQDGSYIVAVESGQSGLNIFQLYPQADQTVKIDCSYVTQPTAGKDYATYPINKTVTIKRVGDPGNGYHY